MYPTAHFKRKTGSNQHWEIVSTWRDVNYSQMQKLKFAILPQPQKDIEVLRSICVDFSFLSLPLAGAWYPDRGRVTILTYAM